ncbi:MAG: hypothetical protein CL920_21955 [Deltaproteobacteria bacterium]|nr:hypothetical protein [Deltaproteobacteria bacterium]MBU51362.1 hypothetical protein [Deltaproteobacteria bacterium]|tara:strand:- start:3195 stop:4580 length:1386 start_codon:yes stop_codon:yes gene_type:complete
MGISHVTILGGGWCGLAAALKLQKAGIQTLILEKQPQVGGLAKTLTWRGFRYDIGASSFYTTEKMVADEFRALMGGTYQTSLKRNQLWFQGRWVSYPLNMKSAFQIPLPTLARASAEYALLQLRERVPLLPTPKHKDQRQHYGYILDQVMMSEYARKIWENPVKSLHPSWSAGMKKERSPIEQLRELFEGLFRERNSHTATFHNPAKGIGSINDALELALLEAGGEIRTGARVHRIFAPDGEVQSVHYHCDGGEHRQQTDYVFSTIPLPSLLTLFDPLPPHALTENAFQLRYRALVFLNILHENADVDPFLHYYFPEQRFPFFRAGYATPVSADSMGHKHACLNVEWFLEQEAPLFDADAHELFDRCREQLEETGLLQHHRVLELDVHREEHAMPVLNKRNIESLRQVKSYLTGIRRIRAIGRQGRFDQSDLLGTVRMGFQAARGILDERSSSRRHLTAES